MKKVIFFGTTCIGASVVGIRANRIDQFLVWRSIYNSISVKKFFVDKNVIFGTTCTLPSLFFSKYAFVIILWLIMLPDNHFDHFV